MSEKAAPRGTLVLGDSPTPLPLTFVLSLSYKIAALDQPYPNALPCTATHTARIIISRTIARNRGIYRLQSESSSTATLKDISAAYLLLKLFPHLGFFFFRNLVGPFACYEPQSRSALGI